MSIEDWAAAMADTTRRRIVLSNLLFDVAAGRIEAGVVRRLFEQINEAWQAESGQRPELLLERVADGTPNDFVCRGEGTPRRCHPVSRIVTDKSLVANNLKLSVIGLLHDDEIPMPLLQRYERRGLPKGAACGHMRGPRPFAWITRTQDLQSLRDANSDPAELAAAIRTKLGLVHYHDDELLIEIEYPEAVANALTLAPPTFLEGGGTIVFRSSRSPDDWGRTVDLESLDAALPEAVHQPVSFTDAFRIRIVGRLNIPAKAIEWIRFYEMCPKPWNGTWDEVRQALER